MGSRRSRRGLGWAVVAAALVMGATHGTAAVGIRVAVTDFTPGGLTADAEQSLGAGLQSMLTTDLATSSHITVVERARLADLRKELKLGHSAVADPATAAKLGRLAGASHLVTGTFTLIGNKLRLDVRVIDVGTGRVALATDATGDRDAFFELEKQVARAIISELGVTLTPKERATFTRVQTADWQAMRRFGDGLRLFDDGDYDRSLQALREASDRDHDFKLAATTLETYERAVREIRSRASVIEAQRDADAALQRRDLGAKEQSVVDSLVAVASTRGGDRAARIRRAVAIYFVVAILDDADAEGLDGFARARLLDAFVARYVHEADGLFPELPMVPFQPMGERWGGPKPPATPSEAEKAIAAAARRFATYDGVKDPEELRRDKEEHLTALFGRQLDRVIKCLHLDQRRGAELTDHFYDQGARFSPRGRWRQQALLVRARQRRALLDIDESTRLFRAAADAETDPGALRGIANKIEDNAKIAAVLQAKASAPCVREWAGYTIQVDEYGPGARLAQDANRPDFCASDGVRHGRDRLGTVTLLQGGVPFWVFQPERRLLSTGPRPAADIVAELRYQADKDERNPWSLIILDGVPRGAAAVSFDLSFEAPPDLLARCAGKRDCLPNGTRPTVTVLFEAKDVAVRGPRRGNGIREDVPMRATGIALGPDSIEKVDAQVLLLSERMGSEGPRPGPGQRQPFPLPATAHVSVTRQPQSLLVEAAGRRLSVDAGPVHPGFVGVLVQGQGFVRLSALRVQPLH